MTSKYIIFLGRTPEILSPTRESVLITRILLTLIPQCSLSLNHGCAIPWFNHALLYVSLLLINIMHIVCVCVCVYLPVSSCCVKSLVYGGGTHAQLRLSLHYRMWCFVQMNCKICTLCTLMTFCPYDVLSTQ